MSGDGRIVPRAELLRLLEAEGGGALSRFVGIVGTARAGELFKGAWAGQPGRGDGESRLVELVGAVAEVLDEEPAEVGQLALWHDASCGCDRCWAGILAAIRDPGLRDKLAAARDRSREAHAHGTRARLAEAGRVT